VNPAGGAARTAALPRRQAAHRHRQIVAQRHPGGELPLGVEAEAKLFDTTSWTVPTLVGTTLFARDREKIVALDSGVQER
jgi:hypothetical protein